MVSPPMEPKIAEDSVALSDQTIADLSTLLQSIDVGPTHTSKGHRLSKAARMRRHKRLLQAAEDLGIEVSLLEVAAKNGPLCSSSSAPCSSSSSGAKSTPSVSPKRPVESAPPSVFVESVQSATSSNPSTPQPPPVCAPTPSLRGHLVKALDTAAKSTKASPPPGTPPRGHKSGRQRKSTLSNIQGRTSIVVPLAGDGEEDCNQDPSDVLGFLGLSNESAQKPRPTLLSRNSKDQVMHGWPLGAGPVAAAVRPPPGLSPPGSKTRVNQMQPVQTAAGLLPRPSVESRRAEAASAASSAALQVFIAMTSAQRLFVKQHMVRSVEYNFGIAVPFPLSDMMAAEMWGPVAHDAAVLHRFLAFADAVGAGKFAGSALLQALSTVDFCRAYAF